MPDHAIAIQQNGKGQTTGGVSEGLHEINAGGFGDHNRVRNPIRSREFPYFRRVIDGDTDNFKP